jgi:endoglucanase
VSPEVIEDFTYSPVVQISQVGYHPAQEKVAVIETDINDNSRPAAHLYRLDEGAPGTGSSS